MSCGISMVKYILFLFNLLCSICGILLIVFGALLFSSIHSFDDFSDAIKTQQVPVAMIVLGCVILLISFFGCCGAIRESYCMSMTYSILLFVMMVGQLAMVAYIWLHKDQYLVFMGDVVEKAWQRRTQKADYMDAIQISMECCGKDSYQDYTFQGYYPASCCKDPQNCRIENVYRMGCKRAFVDFWDINSDRIKYAGLVVAAIETCGIAMIVFGQRQLFRSIDSFDDFSDAIKTKQMPVAMIVLGCVILLISFFGCCGAIRESYCMSMTYSILLFVMMVGQLAMVAYIWLHKDQYLVFMGDVVEKAWERRTTKANDMDAIQISMECCGKDSYQDYSYQRGYPLTCCKEVYCRVENVYRVGCKRAFVDFWDINSDRIKYAGLVIAAIELAGFVLACFLANSIRNYKRRLNY